MRKKAFLILIPFLILAVIFASRIFAGSSAKPGGATITRQQADTIMIMTARENPQYDICFVVDVSGSMNPVLEKLKQMAERVLDYADTNDTLILIKFDDSVREPLIQTIKNPRDKDMFKSWVRKVDTTRGFGTDINAAYGKALKTLIGLNEGRKTRKEPMRIQYLVFVSDGDDIPPAHSPFRNPGSKESLELDQYIKKAGTEKLINILPLGMAFKGYKPDVKVYNADHVPPPANIDPAELQKLDDQLKIAMNRIITNISSTGSPVPKSDYLPLINQLSDKVKLTKSSETKGNEKNTWILNYTLESDFQAVSIDNIQAYANFTNTSGELQAVMEPVRVTSSRIDPGGKCGIEVEVKYPQNWSFEEKKCSGKVDVAVTGDMMIEVDEEIQPSPSPRASISIPTDTPTPTPSSGTPDPNATPAVKTKKVQYRFPFNELKTDDVFSKNVPVEKALFLYAGLGILSLILIPFLLVYNIIVPITVTLKQGDKAMAFRLAHGGKITIGGHSDFTVDGCNNEAAEIHRRFRRFILVEKEKGIIPESYNTKGDRIPLKLSEGFSLNLAGSYIEFEFLPGNQEYAQEKEQFGEPESQDFSDDQDFKF
ncbi:MAG: VWA domain-containing protein [Firmicutes bacterium]|nr:VWA domain-containing protein [Bacillota bacterium]